MCQQQPACRPARCWHWSVTGSLNCVSARPQPRQSQVGGAGGAGAGVGAGGLGSSASSPSMAGTARGLPAPLRAAEFAAASERCGTVRSGSGANLAEEEAP